MAEAGFELRGSDCRRRFPDLSPKIQAFLPACSEMHLLASNNLAAEILFWWKKGWFSVVGVGKGIGRIQGERTVPSTPAAQDKQRKCSLAPSSCYHSLVPSSCNHSLHQECLLFLTPPGEFLFILPNAPHFFSDTFPGLPKMR